MDVSTPAIDRYLRRPEVQRLTGLPTSTLYWMMGRDMFPRPRKLGAKIVGWRESDLAAWQASRPPSDIKAA